MFKEIIELSKLPAFTGGPTEHALFTAVLIVFAILTALVIIFVSKYIVQGIQALWSKLCEIRLTSINSKVKMEEQITEQTRITGR